VNPEPVNGYLYFNNGQVAKTELDYLDFTCDLIFGMGMGIDLRVWVD
jgi:hypothetical protein